MKPADYLIIYKKITSELPSALGVACPKLSLAALCMPLPLKPFAIEHTEGLCTVNNMYQLCNGPSSALIVATSEIKSPVFSSNPSSITVTITSLDCA